VPVGLFHTSYFFHRQSRRAKFVEVEEVKLYLFTSARTVAIKSIGKVVQMASARQADEAQVCKDVFPFGPLLYANRSKER
jgi:hypothetical protein